MYPFGLTHNQNPQRQLENKYLYNGKELQTGLNLGWYDYGARFYQPDLGRFTGIDPIADDFLYITPYNYAENYPTGAIDLWGLQKLVTTVYEVQRTIQDGDLNFKVNQIGPSSTTQPEGAEWSGYKQNNVFFFQGEQVSNLGEIEGWSEWKDNQFAEGARTVGQIMEVTGDVTKVGGIQLHLLQRLEFQ